MLKLNYSDDHLYGAKDGENFTSDVDPESIVECHFCKETAMTKDAVDAGWIPYFYDRSDIEQGPVCTNCIEKHLQKGEDGEMEEKPNV
jgi:hypothetical protein